MSIPQVGQGAVAVVPTFKGFRSAVSMETDAAAKTGSAGFKRVFAKTGAESGKQTGAGFKSAFSAESSGFSSKAVSELERAVSKSAAALSAARLKEQDAAGKVRLAERQLAEAREKYSADSSQVVRAEERLAAAARGLESAQDKARSSTNDLRDAQGRLATAADRAGDELSQAGQRGASKFSSGFKQVFAGSFLGTTVAGLASDLVSNIGYAIGAGLRNAVQFGIGTVDIASSLNESVNAVQVSFGQASAAVLELGKNSVIEFGLSKRNLNAFAVQFSSFANTIRADDPAGFIRELVARGADFASVYDTEVADALALFQSGLAGESEPLRKFGIDLSAASVESYAYASGIAAAGDELTEAQKQQARYGLLLQQTAKVQGDWVNTADSLANVNRRNVETWDDLQAKIGTAFLPVAAQLASILESDVIPIVQDLADEFGPQLGTALQESLPALTELAREVLPEIPGIVLQISEILPGLIQLTEALAPPVLFVTGNFLAWQTVLSSFFSLLSGDSSVTEFTDKLRGIPGPVGDILRALYDLSFGAGATLSNLKTTVIGILGDVGSWLTRSGRALIQGFIDGINQMFSPVGDAVSGILEWVQGFFPQSPAKRGPFSGTGWTDVAHSGQALLEQFQSGMTKAGMDVEIGSAAARVQTTSSASLSPGLRPGDRLSLVVDGQEFAGYVEVRAGTVVAAHSRDASAKLQAGLRRG